MSSPTPTFSTSERDSYASVGFVVRAGVLAGELRELRAAVEEVHAAIVCASSSSLASDAGPVEQIDAKRYQRVLGSTVKWEWEERSREVRSMEPVHHLAPALAKLVDDPRVWAPAADLIGCRRVSLFTDKLNFKRPGGSPFPWHQDSPYWAFGCDHTERLASVQIYLDDAHRENGCLWVVPGSHLHGVLPSPSDRGRLGRLYTDLEGWEGGAPLPIEAPAGSLIYFHGDVVHGSRSNRSSQSRRALVLTYQPPGLPRWNLPDVRPVG